MIQADNLLDFIPTDLRQEVFEQLLCTDTLKLERIISKGHSSPTVDAQTPKSGWYDQATHEWVLLLKGAATLVFEDGEEVSLVAGSHLKIAAHRRHRVQWTAPDTETIWLALHY